MNKWFIVISTPYEVRYYYVYSEENPKDKIYDRIEDIINEIWKIHGVFDGNEEEAYEDFLYLTEVDCYLLDDNIEVLKI